MNILILNWRDNKNPAAGGAEHITERYAKYWQKKGHTIYWISNFFEGGKEIESNDGIHYFRVAPKLTRSTIHNLFAYPVFILKSILLAIKISKEKNIDLVIDEIHGMPYFSPLYLKQRKVLLVCEVAGEIWDKMWPFPINIIGKTLEKVIYRIYENVEMWAISKNTKDDILQLNKKAKVRILPLGIEDIKHKVYEKNSFPSAVFLARLVPMKGIEIGLEAVQLIVKKISDFQLFVIGHGTKEYEQYLKNKVKELGIENNVEFLGFVTEEEKYRQLSKAHFLFHPSYKEGFGLTVLEAGLVGTPAIIKKGSSLDELVTDGVDGYVIETTDQLCKKFVDGINNNYKQLVRSAKEKSKKYEWKLKLKESENITLIP